MAAPTEAQALDALRKVQGLAPEAFERALLEHVGEPMIAVFNALARTLYPDDEEELIAKKLHLMMLAYLMSRSDSLGPT
jgi:hypothetical protein